MPHCSTVNPPIRGPSIQAAVIATPLSALACGRISSSTKSGTRAPIAGIEKAPAPPVRKVITSSVFMTSKPAINANIANATNTAWDKSEIRATVLLGILSTTMPP